jgi:hypothetical protein
MMTTNGVGIAGQRAIHFAYTHAFNAQATLLSTIEHYCPGPHEFVQRRDGLPPWCRQCMYTKTGVPVIRNRNGERVD